jgi:hypothetical protein
MEACRFLIPINRKLDILLMNQDDCCVWLVVSNKNFLLHWDKTLNLCSLGEDSFCSLNNGMDAVEALKLSR